VADNLSSYGRTRSAAEPAIDAASVTPSDSVDLTGGATRGLYVGTGGNINVITVGGTTLVFSNVPDGTTLPISVTRVKNTSTTATNIVALY
jgi:hypothetical protein